MAALAQCCPKTTAPSSTFASALGIVGVPLQSAYCSAKFACRGFFKSTQPEPLREINDVQNKHRVPTRGRRAPVRLVQSHHGRHPQPVPPIYRPELIAKFILRAGLTGRREKVIGSWNKILVLAGRMFPGLGNQYASLGAWSTQLTDEPVSSHRPVNLYEADEDTDHGAHGQFDHMAGGFLDPSYLKTLPTTAKTFVRALGRDLAGKRGRSRCRRRPGPRCRSRSGSGGRLSGGNGPPVRLIPAGSP